MDGPSLALSTLKTVLPVKLHESSLIRIINCHVLKQIALTEQCGYRFKPNGKYAEAARSITLTAVSCETVRLQGVLL